MNASPNGHKNHSGASYGVPDAEGYALGTVRIAHRALRTMIEQAALSAPGVAGIAHAPRSLTLGRPIPWQGIGLATHDQQVAIDLYLLAHRDANLAQTGMRAQEAVVAAVESLLGMQVSEINIYIQDVV